MRPPIPSAVLAPGAKVRKLEDGFFSISGAATPTFLDHSRGTIRPGIHAASTSSRPETPFNFRFFIHPPVGPKTRNANHNTLSLRNQPLRLLTLPQRCTLWTGGIPPWS